MVNEIDGQRYAIPVVDNRIIFYNTDFSFDGETAKATFLVIDDYAEKFMEHALNPKIKHNLGFSFGNNGIGFNLMEDCTIQISGIDSSVEKYTEIELTFKKF